MGHLTRALYLELFPWLINLRGCSWAGHRVAAAVPKSHPACEGVWGGPATSRAAAQCLPARRALQREALPRLAPVASVLRVLVPREGVTAAGIPGCHPGCAAGCQPCRASSRCPRCPCVLSVPMFPFSRSPVRGTIELGMNRLLVYY